MALSESPAIEDLRLLIAVAETGNVTQAAELFGVRQPSVTKRLKVFQGEHALLTSNGKVELTAMGRAVLPSVRELIRQYDQLKAYIAEHRETPNTLCIATGSSASQHFLPTAIALMRKQAAELEIEVQATRGSERIAGVLSGRFDLAILSHDRVQIDVARFGYHQDQAELVVEELARQPICVIAARTSPAGDRLGAILSGQEVPLATLSQVPLIGLDRASGIRRQLERAFANRSERLHYGPNAAGWLAVKEYAKHALGVGVLPLGVLSREDCDDLVIRRLDAALSVNHYLIHREDASNRYLEAVKQALKQAAATHLEATQRIWSDIL